MVDAPNAVRDPLLQVGRLALRQEGTLWNAYWALPDTMEGAVLLGSIRLASITHNEARKKAFVDLMRAVATDQLEAICGHRPTWGSEMTAPEIERGGHG